jgi:glycerol-3-phosphate dehydrogenase
VVNEGFPAAKLERRDVISTWSGLRPLVADKRGNPSDISRRHKISMTHPGWWDVTGGKLTTYRLMGEETVNSITKYLDLQAPRCSTADTPLVDSATSEAFSGILPTEVSSTAVRHYCSEEWARRLDDVMVRRTSWRHYHANHMAIAADVAGWMAAELSWSEEQKQAQLQAYRSLCGGPTPAPHMLMRSAAAHGHSGAPRRQAIETG